MSITSLLNSLHTHLQSQTQLLPTLHTQLGLPATALTDELATLQQRLAACVESQVELRRKQVDEWMTKCDVVERECVRYTTALGSHAKVAGASVGEMRKEQVLPRRYQIVADHQEKLRQLYHTKLEQLTALTNRLISLSKILGFEFYTAEMLQPIPPPSDGPQCDVTPERFSRLEKELVRGKSEVAKRLVNLHATFVQVDWLYAALGIAPPSPDSPSSSLTGLRSPCSSRSSDPFEISTPTPAGRSMHKTPFTCALLRADEAEDGEYERVFVRFQRRLEEDEAGALDGVEPTPGLIAWAEGTRDMLEDVKRRREGQIQAMYDQLEALWRRLGVDAGDMDAFVEHNQGSTEEAVHAYEEELERMMELKRERMGVFVENAREEIRRLWEELMVGAEEQADFAPFADEEHTEELLAIHEEEIRRLKEERRMKAPLLASIKKYFEICEEEKELAAAASDQSRLLGRGPRDPGRLLREEKMRKRVSKEKPRLEQDLLTSIPAWEDEMGRPFLVHGEGILRILRDAATTSEKENAGRRKPVSSSSTGSRTTGHAPPPRAKTPQGFVPGRGGHARVPSADAGSKRAAGVGASTGVPAKKQKLDSSTSTGRQPLQPRSRSRPPSRPPSPRASSSSLPRPVPVVAKPGAHLGHGRVPTATATYRSASTVAATATAAAANSRSTSAAALQGRQRRESFRPRPSMDDDRTWAPGMSTGSRWAGKGSAVKEEEDY